MTQGADKPERYEKDSKTSTYFTSRTQTYGLPALGQIYRMSAIQQNVDYSRGPWWKKLIPFSSVLMAIRGVEKVPDVKTYDFFHESTSMASETKM